MLRVPAIDNHNRYINNAIIASFAIHALVALLCWKSLSSSTRLNADNVFSVELIEAPVLKVQKEQKQERTQIVENSKSRAEPPQEPQKIFEAEEDNASIKNQVKHGDEGSSLLNKSAPQAVNQQNIQPVDKNFQKKSTPNKSTNQNEEPQKTDKPETKHLELKLKLDNHSLAEISASESKLSKEQSTEEQLQQAIQSNASNNQKSSINVSRLGSRDYLPDIPDGEVTLLNTKANKYAVFVRRVASQVFANLRGSGWSSLSAADIRAINQDGVFEAVLSPKGVLLSVQLTTSSESRRFDQVLRTAIQKGAKDPNPPAGAEAEDGNVHFIFQARSWVQIQPNARNGGMNERRWLMLGTGLE